MDVATTLAGMEQRWAARTTHGAAAANLPTGQEVGSAGRRWSAARLPVPGQKFADAIDRMIGDAGQNIAQISLRVEAIHFGGLDEGVHRGGSHAAGIGACKEIIFLVSARGRIARSTALLLISKRPSVV